MPPSEIATKIAMAINMTIADETFGEAALRELAELRETVHRGAMPWSTRTELEAKIESVRRIVERSAKVERLARDLIVKERP